MKLENLLKVAPFSGIRVKPFEGVKKYLSTGDLQEDSLTVVDVDFKSKPSRADIIVETGDVLFARMKGTKKVLQITPELAGTIVSTGFAVLRPDKGCVPAYLATYLNTDLFERQKEKYCSGAIQPAITNGGIEKLELPLPNINDQIRIAHLLGKVEEQIAQRKQHRQKLDDLLKSVFLEMFGDPVRNEKGWNKKPFSDLLSDIESGKSPKCEARPANDEEWGVLKLGAVTRCVFDAGENKALPTAIAPTVKHEVKSGDLLFSRKNTYELVAACAYVYETRPRLLMPDLIFRFVFKENAEVNPIYIWKLLTNESQRKAIQAFAAGAAGSMPNISKANLKTAQLPVPPIELQNQFATIVEKVETLKSRYQQSLNDLESLYGALSQKAFEGKLDLAKILLPDSKNLTGDDVEVSVDSVPPQKTSEQVINKLNKFNNQHTVLLEALNNMPALKIANSPVFRAARELAEQAALWRTPLDQFRNMSAVARAATTIATASNIPEVKNAALIAQQIASAIPKMDMAWLKDQQAIINAAVGPFSEMRHAIATLQLSAPEKRLTESESAVSALQAAVPPDNAAVLALAIQQDDNENEPRYIFTRDDILQVLSGDQPLSAIGLMSKLAELEVITSEGYSRIKTLLFSLLAEEQIQQQFNDEANTIEFRTCA